jgi:hypothetical protein
VTASDFVTERVSGSAAVEASGAIGASVVLASAVLVLLATTDVLDESPQPISKMEQSMGRMSFI